MSEAGSEIFEALTEVLDVERAALIAGDLDKLTALADEKERLLTELAACAPADRPAGLEEKAARNHASVS